MSAEPTPAVPVRRALLSVSDKAGVLEFAQALHAAGVALLSTGGTAKLLASAGLPVTEVSAHTGFPEMMDGRVKTLHPKVHGGLLGRRGIDDAVMAEHGIAPIDLLVVNLYPFAATVAKPDCTYDDGVENIDIGGPAMVRGAAKNHEHVAVVVDPADYAEVAAAIAAGGTGFALRQRLAAKAYAHTGRYDTMVADWMTQQCGQPQKFPEALELRAVKKLDLRYGENPHQSAAFYANAVTRGVGVATARQLQGKALSFTNIADADTALECVRQFEAPACVIVKHANPCGVAVAASPLAAYERAYVTDPTSAFGGIIAFNRPLDAETATAITSRQFVEVIIAPSATDEALAITGAKQNVRVLVTGDLAAGTPPGLEVRTVGGGLLVQDRDERTMTLPELKIVTKRQPSARELEDLLFDQFMLPKTEAHVLWNEYFHGLYDLVSIARSDRTTILVLLDATRKYYDVLERPPDLDPGDVLYPLVGSISDLFRKLRAEHEKIAPRDTVEHYRTHVGHHIKARNEYLEAKRAFAKKVALRDRYRRIISS